VSKFVIYDSGRQRVDLLQQVESVQWLEYYQAPGEVKIIAQITPNNLAMLINGNRIYNPDTDTVAIISHVEIGHTETEEIIIARADLTAQLLNNRVVMEAVNVTNIEEGMYNIYRKNQRFLPIQIGMAKGYSETAGMEIRWGSVLDAQIRLAEVSGLGFRVTFDPETGGEIFKVYKGVDRSDDKSDGYIGYFGTDVDGIESVTVTSDTTDYKNTAVIAGDGEGLARTIRIVSIGDAYGENRRELYVNANDLKRQYQVSIETGDTDEDENPIFTNETHTYTDEEYHALLDARGVEKLAEHLRAFFVTCEVTQNNILYGIDYNLGDRIPVKIPEYGIFATARISSVTMAYEREGNRIIAILDEFELEGL